MAKDEDERLVSGMSMALLREQQEEKIGKFVLIGKHVATVS